ncbi:HIT domain-containing protein [Nonomuraea sp. G32]|nr:HIT domain-containing protein [Nonomuraea sp. G32]MDP4502037.1 HIT domain-containing protein [Nonomuraea sp. G32]
MRTCTFCGIVAGEIPAEIVYSDEHVVAFLDISQATRGHTLVVPASTVAT